MVMQIKHTVTELNILWYKVYKEKVVWSLELGQVTEKETTSTPTTFINKNICIL